MGPEPTRAWVRDVLVVEDDPDLRELIQFVLEEQGLTVETAGDGPAAIEQIDRWRPALVVLDRQLPILDGVTVAAHLSSRHGDSVPVIAMTAASSAAEFGREIGAAGYLSKPFEVDELIALARRLATPEPARAEALAGRR